MDLRVGGHGKAVFKPGYPGECLGPAVDQEWGENSIFK